jgi:tRNA1(Val) A37 N6-methylase TrmN6
MGFGQRLLAALSLPFKVTYVGIDPLEKSVESNQNVFNFLKTNIPMFDKEADIICDGSENYCDPKYIGKVNVAFSSPPYYDQEVYEDSDTQAYSSGSYCSFINDWWRKTMNNIDKLLVEDGLFILNIKDEVKGFNLSKDMINVAREKGYEIIDTYYIQLNKNLVFKNKDSKDKLEPIYVLKKISK